MIEKIKKFLSETESNWRYYGFLFVVLITSPIWIPLSILYYLFLFVSFVIRFLFFNNFDDNL